MNNRRITIKNSSLHQSESGIVAIFSVLIIMGILTLLTLGFSNITRQAVRRTLDDVLSAQAYYAAESGINRMVSLEDLVDDSNTTCENTNEALVTGYSFNPVLDATNNVFVTCMLASGETEDVLITPRIDEPVVSLLQSNSGESISTIEVEWDSEDMDNPDALPAHATPVFTDAASWRSGTANLMSVLRVDLVPLASAVSGPPSRTTMTDNWLTSYLYPTSAAVASNTIALAPGIAGQGVTNMVRCDPNPFSNYRCRAVFSVPATPGYFARIQTYYRNASVRVSPKNGSGAPITMSKSQRSFDSTGRAGDVLRRIQVRVPTDPSLITGYREQFALLTGESVCKRMLAAPGVTSLETGGFPDPACTLP